MDAAPDPHLSVQQNRWRVDETVASRLRLQGLHFSRLEGLRTCLSMNFPDDAAPLGSGRPLENCWVNHCELSLQEQ